MEFIEIIFVILTGGLVSGALIFLTKFNRKSTKSKKVQGDTLLLNENTTQLLESQKTSYELIINGLKSQNKSLQMAVNRYKGIYPEEDEDESQDKPSKVSSKDLEDNYEINVSQAMQLAKGMNLPINIDSVNVTQLLQNPFVKGKIWEYIKKNKDQMIQVGVIIPKGTTPTPEIAESKPENQENSGTMNLEFSDQNAKYMA